MIDPALIDRIAYALADEPFPQPWWGGAEFRAKAEKIAKACGLTQLGQMPHHH